MQRNATQQATTLPGAWPTSKIVEVLGTRVAMAAIRGNSQPIAAAVVARLESGK